MQNILLLTIVILFASSISTIQTIAVGLIQNTSLIMFNSTVTSFTGSLQQCLCQLANESFLSFSLNYFSHNQTCRLYLKSDQNKSFVLISYVTSHFYFLSLPYQNLSIPQSTHYHDLSWLFDSNSSITDTSQTFSGILLNNPTFSSSSISGYGYSLSFTASLSQGVVFPNPFLNLSNKSWTFEVWIYLSTSPGSTEWAIIGQCASTSTRRCLHLTIRNTKIYFGLYSDDLTGFQTLVRTTWYHIAFAFDCSTRNQSLYINGIFENTRTTSGCYQGSSGSLSFGILNNSYDTAPFNGLIDQITYVNRTKTANEILRDATLTVSFSFDDTSVYDEGPLKINASLQGQITSISSGRLGQALYISNVNYSFLALQNLVLLGTSAQSYSISIWLRPNYLQQATIILLSSEQNNSSINACLSLIGMNSSGHVMSFGWNGSLIRVGGPVLIVNVWNHVAVTYSSTNGLRLYVNGSRWNISSPYVSIGIGVKNSLWVEAVAIERRVHRILSWVVNMKEVSMNSLCILVS